MPIPTSRTARFVRSWLSERPPIVEEELTIRRGERVVPATLVRPRHTRSTLPGWIVLHGITRPGRRHDQLLRFTRALASTGCAALVPEVPEWSELDLAPGLTVPTVEAGVAALSARPDVVDGRFGLVGFSFGAPHSVAAAGADSLRDRIAGAVAFGGYCDLPRTIRFMLTGRHEWQGEEYRTRPDPYGRWIVAANYLTEVPGREDSGDVADALRRLAAHTGDARYPAWDPRYDPVKAELRESVDPARRDLYDLFAPPTDREPDPAEGETVARELAAAAARVDPAMDAAPALARVRCPVHVLHGRYDHLIPFSEGLRLHRSVGSAAPSTVTVTRLFGHSAQDPFPGVFRGIAEGIDFLRSLGRILDLA